MVCKYEKGGISGMVGMKVLVLVLVQILVFVLVLVV